MPMSTADPSPAILAALTGDLVDTVAYLRANKVHELPPMTQVKRIEAALDEAFTESGQARDFDQARLMLAVCLHFLIVQENGVQR
jgi:hypothetical protein